MISHSEVYTAFREALVDHDLPRANRILSLYPESLKSRVRITLELDSEIAKLLSSNGYSSQIFIEDAWGVESHPYQFPTFIPEDLIPGIQALIKELG